MVNSNSKLTLFSLRTQCLQFWNKKAECMLLYSRLLPLLKKLHF